MNDAWQDQYEDLWSQSQGLEQGPTRVAVLEEAARLADTHQDVGRGFEARTEIVQAATFGGLPDQALVAFSWCLAQCDRQPERFHEGDLLWKYKWVVNSLGAFPQIPRATIEEMLTDLQKRYERNGAGLRVVHMLRWKLAKRMGDRPTTVAYHRLGKKAPRDWLADCAACDQNAEVSYALFINKDEQALKAAAPILAGSMRCAEIPHSTYPIVLAPLLRLGRLDEAADYHRRGLRLVNGRAGHVDSLADHLTFLALTDNLAKGNKLLEKNLTLALQGHDLDKRYDFFLATLFFLQRWQAKDKAELKLRLPRAFALYQEEGRYATEALAAWFALETEEIARRFDQRNGNDSYVKKIRQLKKLHQLVAPHPV